MLPVAFHSQRPSACGHIGPLHRHRAGRHVASPPFAAVDYFISAGALFGRFVHACGLVTRALDVPRLAAGWRHHGTTGYATGEAQKRQIELYAHPTRNTQAARAGQVTRS